jgi:hypothetical protein
MSTEITRFTKTIPGTDGERSPLPFMEWIKQSNLDIGRATQYKSQYTEYVSNWYTSKKESDAISSNTINERYTTFINNVVVDYTNDAERKFLTNIDVNSSSDLETVIPYIARSIKGLLVSYHDTREDIKYQKIKYSLAGTKYGLEKITRNLIYKALKNESVQIKYKKVFDVIPIKDIVNELVINIEEYYDLAQDYYDNDTQTDTETLRGRVQNQVFDREIIHDVDSALTSLESQYTVLSDDTTQVTTSDLTSILIQNADTSIDPKYKLYDYINYTDTDNINTNYQVISDLAKEDLGTDIYTITTDSNTNYQTTKISTKSNNHNLLNIHYPTINYVSSDDYIHSIRELGTFRNPNNLAVQRYYSHNITPIILKERLAPNTTYVLPDIYTYGNIANNTTHGINSPVDHVEDTSWVKSDVYNYAHSGHINNSKKHNKFYGYVSTNEIQNFHERGPARSTDNYDFWEGDEDDIWAQQDLYPISNPYDYDYESKVTSMLPVTGYSPAELINNHHKTVVKYYTDVYGNEWFLLKLTNEHDRATNDLTEVSLATEGEASITCTTAGGESFTVDLSQDAITIDGGGLNDVDYVPQSFLVDYLQAVDGLECTDDDILSRLSYLCHTIDGDMFQTESYSVYTGIEFNGTGAVALTADAGFFFMSTPCDPDPPKSTSDEIEYSASIKFTTFELPGEYYESEFTPSTISTEYSNSIYDKKNVTLGELWMRNSVTGDLVQSRIGIKDFNIEYDVMYILSEDTVNGNLKDISSFYRIKNNWSDAAPSLVKI